MNKPRAKYKPPIPWTRFDAMTIALFKRIYHGEPISVEMANEVYHALLRLRDVYQVELQRTLPNRRAKRDDLESAKVANLLMLAFKIDLVTALTAAQGKKPREVERDTLASTQQNRLRKARESGVFAPPALIDAARRRLHKAKKNAAK